MISLKQRLFFLLFLALSSSVVGVYIQQANKSHILYLSQAIEKSESIVSLTEQLEIKNFHEEDFKELQEYRKMITQKERQILLSDLLQAYSNQIQANFNKKRNTFLDSEKQFQTSNLKEKAELESKLDNALYISLLIAAISLAAIAFILQTKIFSQLKTINERMNDFFSGKYQYTFLPTVKNEVGQIQFTFNAIAQQVVHNMNELKALDSAKSDFLNIASHELRTPMTSIKGSLGLINSGSLGEMDPTLKQLCQIAEQETDRLIRMTNDFLDLAKIEAGRLPLAQKWHSLSSLLHQCATALTGLQETMGVKIEVLDIPHLDVYVDHDRIQQVITNLLSNAIKFSPKGQVVQIRSYINEQVFIEIIDFGKGIKKEDQELIFQKFRQATSAQNPLVKGTGLGLAIAKALTEGHGGQIGVRSRPNHGSTFYFSLPKYRDSEITTATNSEAA